MKKYFSAGHQLMSIDTETFNTKVEGTGFDSRIDYVYRIKEDGQFQHGEQIIDVVKGDVIFLLYGYNKGIGKIIKITEHEYITELAEYDAYCKELVEKREATEGTAFNAPPLKGLPENLVMPTGE